MNTHWKHIATVPDSSPFSLDGVNIWKQDWTPLDNEIAIVRDPLYGQEFRFHVYRVMGVNGQLDFAAGEFSNCMWGFYVRAVAPSAGTP